MNPNLNIYRSILYVTKVCALPNVYGGGRRDPLMSYVVRIFGLIRLHHSQY